MCHGHQHIGIGRHHQPTPYLIVAAGHTLNRKPAEFARRAKHVGLIRQETGQTHPNPPISTAHGIPLGGAALIERCGGIERSAHIVQPSDDIPVEEEGTLAQLRDAPAKYRQCDVGLVISQGGVRYARRTEGLDVPFPAVHGA